ncbi:hypothetical protein AQ616_09365 [Oceanobacillus sp. E9]|uniref:YqaJ viral recombinase family protein n=1 Tax=Oceanobacillus sp. E9 TaxID=1742575 RepID=UPI00084E945E|nr:YqaJ viral recombinase family protein [Oceanobacillus sp. E9]OEH55240.1 hypothetical protein AQ616_09365 [Oceanobacillus sp. E9]
MITTTSDRFKYIGGSEANMIYMKYDTKTFIKWWEKKLAEVPEEEFNNKSMAIGTILEHDIIDLYESENGVIGIRDESKVKGIARANTDYILGDKVSDVKATSKAFEWLISGKIPPNYKRQLIHYMYVFELPNASIIAYQVDEERLLYPFDSLDLYKLFEIPVNISAEQLQEHRQRVEYLEHCRDLMIFPKE